MPAPQPRSLIVAVVVTAAAATHAQSLPANVPLPANLVLYPGTLVRHAFDEAEVRDGAKTSKKRGHFLTTSLQRQPEGSHQPADVAWKTWLPLLTAQGWTPRATNESTFTLSRSDKGVETWLTVQLAEFQDPRVTLLEVSGAPTKLDLPAPAAKPDPVADTADWPFLKAFPGAVLDSTGLKDEPLDVTVGGVDKEPHLVGQGYRLKTYTPPATLSKLETELSYRDALTRAGWTVLPLPAGVAEGEGVVRAHFSKNGRDVWAVVGRAADDSNTGLSIAVADAATEDWAKRLTTDCRLALYGVTFDFDKATLRPESTPVLEKAAAALQANATLAFEVQGHTDDVGDEAYNQKLSSARAEAVRAWLTAHGVVAARLSARGYGKNQPIADNGSDAGRAKNRRVELSCRKP